MGLRLGSGNLHDEADWNRAWDHLSGKPLRFDSVSTASWEAIEYFKSMHVYSKVPIEECIRETGKKPIGVRSVDIHKRDEVNHEYRSSPVAK